MDALKRRLPDFTGDANLFSCNFSGVHVEVSAGNLSTP